MPLITTLANISARGYGFFRSTFVAFTNFIVLTVAESGTLVNQMYIPMAAPSGNIYVVGGARNGGITASSGEINKTDSTGTTLWQITNDPATGTGVGQFQYADMDSTEAIYGMAYIPTSLSLVQLVKTNGDGTWGWAKQFTPATAGDDWVGPVAVDRVTDTIHTATRTLRTTGVNHYGLFKAYNTSGTLLWQRMLNQPAALDVQPLLSRTDTAGNVYHFCQTQNATPAAILSIVKYNSSGAVQFQKSILGAIIRGAVFAPSGNVYLMLCNSTTSQIVMKLNSAWTIQWSKKLSTTPVGTGQIKMCLDADENIYVCGGSNTTEQLIKYDTNGNFQFSRQFTMNAVAQTASSVDITSDGQLFVTLLQSGNRDFASAMKVPLDGTKTATYTIGGKTLIYSNGTVTDGGTDATFSVITDTYLTEIAGTMPADSSRTSGFRTPNPQVMTSLVI